jgi:YHS domain-containing protein
LLNDSGLIRKPAHRGALHPGQAVDPVCGEVVDSTDANLIITRKGRKIHFCSPQCRDEYYLREKHEQLSVAHTG